MKKRSILAVSALTLLCALAAKGEIVLAANGKSNCRIVAQPTCEMEKLAVADLAKYLKRITGADFAGKEAKHLIYVGKRAPSDQVPLKANERRVRSEAGDLYICGEGEFGTAFAVYDFLEEFLGCRWYTVRGRKKIPSNPSPRFEKIEFSRIPSFHHPYLSLGIGYPTAAQMRDYTRRNRIFALTSGIVKIGPGYSHVPGQLIPPGKKYKEQIWIWKPYKYSAGDEWFGSHPEYFSLNREGKRIPYMQLCYSNPELRKLLESKLEEIVAKEYRSGVAYMRCDLNDNAGFNGETICCCENCMKLVEKYRSPAGPYWDFVLDLCGRWKLRHPGVVLVTSAYLTTEKFPSAVETLPANLAVNFCPLNKNFLKPYDHTSNREVYERFAEWGSRCENLWVQLYPTVYPRATGALPLAANLRRLARDLRICKKFNVKKINLEQGLHWGIAGAFNELRQYLLARMLNNVGLDENALVEEFIRDNYGKAAPMMSAYWKELEALEAEEPVGLTWFGLNYGSFTYLTGENLARWSRDFDKMEELAADDPEALRDVRDARFNLDEAILSVLHRLPATPEFDRDRVAARARRSFLAGLEPFLKPKERAASAGFKKLRVKLLDNGLDYFYAANGAPAPLPPGLRQEYAGPIRRVLPDRALNSLINGVKQLSPDPKSAFGVALKSNLGKRENPRIVLNKLTVCAPSGKTAVVFFNDVSPINMADVQKHRGEYKLYFCGRTRLFPQSTIFLTGLDKRGWAQVGQWCDARDPEAEYDVYLSLKVDDGGVLWFGEVVLCGTGRKCPAQRSVAIAQAAV